MVVDANPHVVAKPLTRRRLLTLFGGALSATAAGCGGSGDDLTTFRATSADAPRLQPTIAEFRAVLGVNNGVGGSSATGRREVNWDGVPPAFEDPFPPAFFNSNSPRGILFSTPGSRLKVSGASGTPSFLFADVTAQRCGADEFAAFSPDKFLASIGSTEVDVAFFVPGTRRAPPLPASVPCSSMSPGRRHPAGVPRRAGRADRPPLRRAVRRAVERVQFRRPYQPVAADRAGAHRRRTQADRRPLRGSAPDGVAINDVIFGEPVALR